MHIRRWGTGLAAAVVLLLLSSSVAWANPGSVIDFEENLDEGDIVGTLSDGNGIGGDPTTITVEVNSAPDAGHDMIFVADCSGLTCSGSDDDLSAPGHGNILIYSEDLDSGDPDDIDGPNTLSFVFSAPVTLSSVWIIDNEEGLVIRMYSDTAGTTLLHTVNAPTQADGVSGTVGLDDTANVRRIDFVARGSIGIDELDFFVPLGGGEGCTPGYWKNHTDRWTAPYDPSDSFDSTFGVTSTDNPTLLEAVGAGGGGEIALQRHAVAALLNAAHGDVDSGQTVQDVIDVVQDAYDTGDFEDAKDELEDINEQGCPLSGTSATTGGGNPNANSRKN